MSQTAKRNAGKLPVQIWLTPDQHRLVGIAAALDSQTKVEFALQSTLAMAKAVRAKYLNGA